MSRVRHHRKTALRILAAMLTCAVVVPSGAAAQGRCGAHPWCNTSLSPDARAALLLAAMTPQERIGMLGGDDLSGAAGGEHKHTGTQNGIPRLDVPTIYYSDGPLGPRQGQITGMPSPMADAATFDPRANSAYGREVGEEARAKGNDVIYGPTVNLVRTPLWGRTFETFGEDPFLVSQTAVAWIDGLQSTGVMADIKHFAENNQEGRSPCCANLEYPGRPLQGAIAPPDLEGGRMTVNVHVDERTLHELELAPFEAAVTKAHVASIMCSYNLLGGTHACENDHLLRDIPTQWGFKGYILSDYLAAHDTGPSLRTGLDFEPWPGFDVYGPIPVNAALLIRQATQADVDRHVLRMLRTFFAYGVFDRAAFADNTASIPQVAHRRISQRIEEQAITLLRNRGHVLPLNAAKLRSIAIIGKGATTFVTGGGSGNVTPFRFVSPAQAIAARVRKGTTVTVNDGSNVSTAIAAARAAQVAVVLTPDFDTEGVDRLCLTLECPTAFGDQDALIRAVAAANKHTIVVLETGGPELTPWRGKVAALLDAWYPGQEGGTAITRVLFGDVDPGGRLPATFPDSERQLPTAGDPRKYPGVNNQVFYSEGVFAGYRWYDAHKLKPAFPFGYGLSYTTWRLGTGALRGRTVAVRVRNTGRRTGSTVVQLYLGLPSSGAVPQPPHVLRGYRKVTLRPGRSAVVRFHIGDHDLAYWNTGSNGWRIAAGTYRVWAGFSSRDLHPVGTIRQRREIATG